MKRLIVLLMLVPILSCTSTAYLGQDQKVKDAIQESIRCGHFKVENSQIVVSGIIENLDASKNDLYIRAKAFFTRTYRDANSVIQTDDKEAGVLIAKGIFPNFHSISYRSGTGRLHFSSTHILRVDIRDNRIRVICSVDVIDCAYVPSTFNRIMTNVNNAQYSPYVIVDHYPFTDKKAKSIDNKRDQIPIFNALEQSMHGLIMGFEKVIREGIISGENEDW